ncbi:MAG: VacJ family lipoprotein [Magnetospirillum sp.]|nr:VacJ family lipoprotein [Magnetospirillum sp.]
MLQPPRVHFAAALLASLFLMATGQMAVAEDERQGFHAELRHAIAEAERTLPPPVAAPAPALTAPPSALQTPHPVPTTPAPTTIAAKLAAPAKVSLFDPLEILNRGIYIVNIAAMTTILSPVVTAYQTVLPKGPRKVLGNIFRNLREPIYLASALLQGEWSDAQTIISRFIINSTMGIAGAVDQATRLGFTQQIRPIDQALCSWGIPTGPYLVLPLYGPSSVRDATARVATIAVQFLVLNVFIIPYRIIDGIVQYSEMREAWEALGLDASDGYERMRSIYEAHTKQPCNLRNAADNGLFFQ